MPLKNRPYDAVLQCIDDSCTPKVVMIRIIDSVVAPIRLMRRMPTSQPGNWDVAPLAIAMWRGQPLGQPSACHGGGCWANAGTMTGAAVHKAGPLPYRIILPDGIARGTVARVIRKCFRSIKKLRCWTNSQKSSINVIAGRAASVRSHRTVSGFMNQ